MHELAIVEDVIDTVTERLPDKKITSIRLEIGELSGVVADALLFSFGLATEGTNLAGATLEISSIPGRCRCRSCGSEFSPERPPFLLCPCGSADAVVLAGNELKIASVKVA